MRVDNRRKRKWMLRWDVSSVSRPTITSDEGRDLISRTRRVITTFSIPLRAKWSSSLPPWSLAASLYALPRYPVKPSIILSSLYEDARGAATYIKSMIITIVEALLQTSNKSRWPPVKRLTLRFLKVRILKSETLLKSCNELLQRAN